jgi:hypothetical protein
VQANAAFKSFIETELNCSRDQYAAYATIPWGLDVFWSIPRRSFQEVDVHQTQAAAAFVVGQPRRMHDNIRRHSHQALSVQRTSHSKHSVGEKVLESCCLLVPVPMSALWVCGCGCSKDPEREMIKLSTYLGHSEPAHTYWYIEAAPELLALASERAAHTISQERGR